MYHAQHATGDPSPGQLVTMARDFLRDTLPTENQPLVEIEVDDLEQLAEVLGASPDIIMLDNMEPDALRTAVAQRDEVAPLTELEASGGISMDTVRSVAETGVERISVGALTHSAASLDVGLDWE